MLRDWPMVPSRTSWWATRPWRRTECTRMGPALPPRAPLTTSSLVGSSIQSSDAAAMRSAVSTAVPDGASTFWPWWSSMTSADSK